MSADLVSIFHKTSCTSGFICHLYQHELTHLYSSSPVPRPGSYRLSPTSYLELPAGDNPATTLCQSVRTKLGHLLTTIQSSQTHFVLCVKQVFDTGLVTRQCRALSILETCHVMADSVMVHKTRLTHFYTRYYVCCRGRRDKDNSLLYRCQNLVNYLKKSLGEKKVPSLNNLNIEWEVGTTHVCYSEGARQVMEGVRNCEREKAANMIQRWWGIQKRNNNWSCDVNVILQTLSLHGLDKVSHN